MTNKIKNMKKALETIIDVAYPRVTPYHFEKFNINGLIRVRSLNECYFINVGRTWRDKVRISFYTKYSEDYGEKVNLIVSVFESYNDSKTMFCFEVMKYLLKHKLI